MSGSDPRPVTDLGVLARDARYELTRKAAEGEEEGTARLQREGWEHKVKPLKDVALFLAALLGAVVIVYYCLTVLNDPAAREDTQKWAMSILSGAVSGIVGYLLGKKA